MPRRHLHILIPLLLITFWLTVSSLVNDSPTMDEQNHIARGLAFLRTGDPRLSLEHPPLINSLSALPLLTLELRLPTDHPSWNQTDGWYAFADQLLWEYNPQFVSQIIFLARIPIVFILLILSLIGYRFASQLWHPRAGLIAATLLLFDPNIIAHARYSTTDIGGATTLLLAMFALWCLFNRSHDSQSSASRTRLCFAATAVTLGFAWASKLSNLGFVPIFAFLAVLPIYNETWTIAAALRRLLTYLLAGAISIVVVWALFGFEWSAYNFVDAHLSGLNKVSGPLPTFFEGTERIALTTSTGRDAFLLGDYSSDGFPLYFPIAFLVKTPLPTLLLIAAAALFTLNFRETRGKAFFLLIPALIFFSLTMRSGLNIGYRHLTPMVVLLYVLVAGLTPHAWRQEQRLTLRSFIVIVGTLGVVATSLLAYPHYLGYFNPIVGRDNGWQVLGDSNIDWGQDLIRLRNWMADEGITQVKLSYFGSARPDFYVQYAPLPSFPNYHRDLWEAVPFDTVDPEQGVYAISVANLHELHHQNPTNKTVFSFFREHEPDERIGSFNIYKINEQ